MTQRYTLVSSPPKGDGNYLAIPEVSSKTGKVINYRTRYVRPIARWAFMFLAGMSAIALALGLAGLLHSVVSESQSGVGRLQDLEDITTLVDRFAYTITRRDIPGNVDLFIPDGVANYLSVFPEFASGNHTVSDPPGVDAYVTDLESIYLAYISSHMTLSNINITLDGCCRADVDSIGFLSRTIDDVVPPITYKTHLYSFSMYFEMQKNSADEWLISFAHTLVNATKSESLGPGLDQYFGSAAGAATMAKKRTVVKRAMGDLILWQNLQSQIDNLISSGHTDNARDICNTEIYISLAMEFDPASSPSFFCNQPVPIEDVPLQGVMTCAAGSYIDQTCLNVTLSDFNVTLIVPTDIFETVSMGQTLEFETIAQLGNQVWASPASGAMGVPGFRYLQPADIPDINLATQTIGILPIANGGTNSGTALSGNALMVSNPGGTAIVEGPAVPTSIVESVGLGAPTDLFDVSGSPVTTTGTLSFAKKDQAERTVWAAPLVGSGTPVFRALDASDIPDIDLATQAIGVLPIANGGTNSSDPLSGNSLMVSNPGGTAIVEGPPIPSSIVESVGLGAPTDLFDVSGSPVTTTGTLSFGKKNQAERTFWAGPTQGLGTGFPVFRTLEAEDLPPLGSFMGVLTTDMGGTGSNLTLVGDKIIMSNGAGTGMVEGDIVGDNGITIMTGPGSLITVSNGGTCSTPISETCVPNTLSLDNLAVSGSTLLGTNTSCVQPLMESCYDISSQSCSMGALAMNCIPMDLYLNTLVVQNLTLINTTGIMANLLQQEALYVDMLQSNQTLFTGPVTCDASNLISQDCFSLGGKTCPMGMPISESCIPASLIFYDISVLNDLVVNNMTCSGDQLPESCLGTLVRTINGIMPDVSSDFTIDGGSGITVTTIPGGVSISNDGVTSVALAAPAAEFSVSGSPVTTTGTLTFSKVAQTVNTVWAGPISGGAMPPTFRLLDIADMPPLLAGQLYIGTGTSVVAATLTDGTGITITEGAGTITIAVNAAAVNHDALLNFVANEHVDHSAVSVTAGTGLSGGGDITASRTLNIADTGVVAGTYTTPLSITVNAQGQLTDATEVSFNISVTDLPALMDGHLYIGTGTGVVEATLTDGSGITITEGVGSITIAVNAAAVDHDALLNFVANEHVDHSTVSVTAGTGLSGGGDITASRTLNIADTGVAAGTYTTPLSITVNAQGQLTNAMAIPANISIGLDVPMDEFSIAGSPANDGETMTITKNPQMANTFWGGPVNGSDAEPTFRALQTEDLPIAIALSYTYDPETTTLTDFTAPIVDTWYPIPGLEFNLTTGTHFVTCSYSIKPSNSVEWHHAMHQDGTIVLESHRHSGGSSTIVTIHSQAVITVTSEMSPALIEMRTARTGNADLNFIWHRNMFALRLA